ncbi:MAG: SDR family oxidoreductase [Pseudomonadota bacterium]
MTQRVFITAGAGGIGLAIAKGYAALGAHVFTCDRDADAVAALPEGIVGAVMDVTDEAALDAWLDEGIAQFGGCDVLINNAGIAGQTGPVEDLDLAQWQNCMAVNLDTQMLTCRRIVPLMKAQGSGVITNLSSTSGLYGVPFPAPYVAAKWAVIGLTKTLATELGPFGIRCNAICPGAVSGKRMERVLAAEAEARGCRPEDVYTDYVSGTSLRRFAQPEEVAQLCLYLSSEAARFVSGQAIAVDGHTETYHAT